MSQFINIYYIINLFRNFGLNYWKVTVHSFFMESCVSLIITVFFFCSFFSVFYFLLLLEVEKNYYFESLEKIIGMYKFVHSTKFCKLL